MTKLLGPPPSLVLFLLLMLGIKSEQKTAVTWSKIVWFAKAIPRFAFITWLAIKDQLSTKERLAG